MAPNSTVSCFVILSLKTRAPANGNGGMGIGSTRTPGLSTRHLPSVNFHGTAITLWMPQCPISTGECSLNSCCDDSTCQHHCVLDEPRSIPCLLSLRPSVVTSALHISATRFENTMIAGSVSLFKVISLYKQATLSFVHGSSMRHCS